jgi:hypothetical protein
MTKNKTTPPILDEETDAEVAPNAETTWIGVKQFSVYIKKTPEGISVGIYARGAEDCDELAGCYAFDDDALFTQETNDDD